MRKAHTCILNQNIEHQYSTHVSSSLNDKPKIQLVNCRITPKFIQVRFGKKQVQGAKK